jgi:hypothetical protein
MKKKNEGKRLEGVYCTEVEKFIENTFDLPKYSIKHKLEEFIVKNKEQEERLLNKFSGYLARHLAPNCATIITIFFERSERSWGHSMIAYNHNKKITYFCPQTKTKYIHLKNMTRGDKNWLITGYGYYSTFDFFDSDNIFDDDIPIKNSTCPITFGTPTSRG